MCLAGSLSRFLASALFALGCLVGSATLAQSPAVPAAIAEAMQDRDFGKAITAIETALADEKNPRDYLAYLKGRALHLAERYDDAVAAYEAVEKDYPDSPWARRARFAQALSLARKGDFASAEKIYRAETAYLLSVARKQELAGIYLEFADAYFKPKDPTQPADYTKALEFYSQALDVGPEPQRRVEVELRVAECFQALANLGEAAARYSRFAKEHPADPLEVEARFRLGDCQLGMGQPLDARRTWQDLIAERSNSKSERIAEAAFRLCETYGLPTPGSDVDLDLGVAALETFLTKYAEHKLSGAAHLRIAQSQVHRGRFEAAVKALRRFLADEKLADRDDTPHARSMLGQSYLLQKKFPEALAAYRDFLSKHPAHELWSHAQQQIVQIEYLQGLEKLTAKDYAGARESWNDFLARYPLDGRNPRILYQLGAMSLAEEKYDEAIAEWRRLVSKYPQTEESSQAQYSIGLVLEEKQHQYEEAIKEYRKLAWGSFAAHAASRIVRLTEKSVVIASERIFRSDEPPVIKLTSRNVEKVSVRCYTVDLETYFRKMHLASGLEGLDIALIDPDHSFEFTVPDYAEHKLIESQIECPLPKQGDAGAPPAGVMAVTVSSKTLEATTMIIQSDLDMIVKSSRDELFVFAENMRTGEPWPGARLLISNGSQVFAEGTTGDDGVFRNSFTELHDAADVRVFAVAGGSAASSNVSLQGLSVATGISSRGYIYTDRPAYRAGQVVNVRGIVRRAEDDEYKVDAGRKFTVDIFDPRGRLLRQEKVALGDYGSFHFHFALPMSAAVGDYRMMARDEEETTYQGAFTVHEYQLEPVRLAVETERKVFYRGEEIEGKITAKFYYGAPLSGREIRYQLAGGRIETATTDENGEVRFKLATREFRESQVLQMVVLLPERNLQTVTSFFLATQGFTIGLSAPRSVYVAGESFETTIRATDAEGKPLAQKLTVHVLEQTRVDGRVGERTVSEHEVITDDQGVARLTLKLEQGGRYILRATGTDRFENPVTSAMAITVSDDKDTVRLRILSERHTFKVGDEARLIVHWRDERALALVTYQGAKVQGYRLVHLAPGANELVVPMTEKLAPNFVLSVALMTDLRGKEKDHPCPCTRFHEATSPFFVERGLTLALDIRRKAGAGELRPGDEIEVVVKATDPQGKPVAAEISLAMVEQALLERFGSPAGSIGPFFHGGSRAAAVRSGASIAFEYRPQTRPIDRRLLAEAERAELEAEEKENRERLLVAGGQPGGGGAAGVGLQGFAVNAPGVAGPGGNGQANFADLDDMIQLQAIDGTSWSMNESGEGQVMLGVVASGDFSSDVDGEFEQSANVVNVPALRIRSIDESSVPFDDAPESSVSNGKLNTLAAPGKRKNGGRRYANIAGRIDDSRSTSFITTLGRPSRESDVRLELNRAFIPTAEHLSQLGAVAGDQVFWYDAKGEFKQAAGAEWARFGKLALANNTAEGRKAVAIEARRLAAAGIQVLVAAVQHETGYWNPTVVTNDQGEATVTFALPERSTGWRFTAHGITQSTLAGEATKDVQVKKELFGDLKLPLAFTDGDAATIPASVHNTTGEKSTVEVTLRTTIAGKSFEEKKTLDLAAGAIVDVPFDVKLARPEGAAPGPDVVVIFELTVAAGERSDMIRRAIPLQPHGLRVYATSSGSAESDITAWVDAPGKMPMASRHLQVLIGPTVERGLLDIVLGTPVWCQRESSAHSTGLESTTSDLLAALALQKLLAGTRQGEGPHASALDERVRGSLALVIASQNDDGGWSWTGRGGASNRFTTARVVWSLAQAKKSGYSVPQDQLDRAAAWLQSQSAATPENEFETKAIFLFSLSTLGQGDFALANRLYRSRPSLSNAALVHLALSFALMDRKPAAQDVLEVLAGRNLDEIVDRRVHLSGVLAWSASAVELHALYALALAWTQPESPAVKEQVDWLMAHRTGHRWAPDKATGPAAAAVCEWFSRTRFEGQKYTLTIFANERKVTELELSSDSLTETVEIPDELLAEGRQRISFQIKGRGRYSYQCILGGFVAADQLKGTTEELQVHRSFEPAPLELDGQVIPRGFDVLAGNYNGFTNPLTQLPVGKRGIVKIQPYRVNIPGGIAEDQLNYLVIREPLPSGASVLESSIRGGFERYEISPGAITFYVGTRFWVEEISYELHGYVAGSYRAAPTVIFDAYRPDYMAVAGQKELAVLPLGKASADEYKLSPRELYELGKRRFDRGEKDQAIKYLAELMTSWTPNVDVYRDAARMLLDAHLEHGPADQVVRYFEIMKERWPDLELPFEKIVKVGLAYDEMGEYERSYLIFRATVEGSFRRESSVAGFLEQQGEILRSVDVMQRLLREYPPEAYQAAATYFLAQRVYAKAAGAADDPKLREKKENRVTLTSRALAMLDGFLTEHPDDPAADQASFSLATALVDLEAWPAAIGRCRQFEKRYPQSKYLDSYWFVIGFAHFAQGQHDDALAMCRQVSETRRVDPATGREVEASNKWQAVYIQGQVHHSLGRAKEAIDEYQRVSDRFPDARAAIDYFAKKAIALEEVTAVEPGKPAELELKFRNVPKVDVKVYRIDLMKFSLLKRNLAGITAINLAGIRPFHEEAIELGDGRDYRDRTRKLERPLKEEGAYLVVCRGEDLHTSGLALVTPLVIEVQEEATSGRVRATVKDKAKDSFVPAVHIKAIGSRNSDFFSGKTDLRGVYVADGLAGTSTVIAQADGDRYAFYRGSLELGPTPQPAAPAVMEKIQQMEMPAQEMDAKGDYLLRGIRSMNDAVQQDQNMNLDQLYRGKPSGVRVQDAAK